MIDKILDEIHESAVMYLINAIVFDAEWKVIYNESNIYEDTFYLADGTKKTVDFMRSEESLFLDDGRATGFIKPYYDDKYSFAALLPNEGISLDSYIESLSGEGLLDTVADAEMVTVNATMPKFSYEYEIQLNEILKSMGMPAAFDSNIADFQEWGSPLEVTSLLAMCFIKPLFPWMKKAQGQVQLQKWKYEMRAQL